MTMTMLQTSMMTSDPMTDGNVGFIFAHFFKNTPQNRDRAAFAAQTVSCSDERMRNQWKYVQLYRPVLHTL